MRFAVWPARRAKEDAIMADGLGGDRDDGTETPPYHLTQSLAMWKWLKHSFKHRSASAKSMLTSSKYDWLMRGESVNPTRKKFEIRGQIIQAPPFPALLQRIQPPNGSRASITSRA